MGLPLATSSFVACIYLLFLGFRLSSSVRVLSRGSATPGDRDEDALPSLEERWAAHVALQLPLPEWFEQVLDSCNKLPEVINEFPIGKVRVDGEDFFEPAEEVFKDTDGRDHMLFDADGKRNTTELLEDCPLIGRNEAIELISQLASIVQSGALSREEFIADTWNCGITTCKAKEIRQSLEIAMFIEREDDCGSDTSGLDTQTSFVQTESGLDTQDLKPSFTQKPSDTQESFEACLATVPLHLNSMALPPIEPATKKVSCNCAYGEPLKREDLLELVDKHGIPRGPAMMRDAAGSYCSELGRREGAYLGPHFNMACAPENYGYCCIPMTKDALDKKDEYIQKSIIKVVETIERAIGSSESLQHEIEGVMSRPDIDIKEKVMLYKLYIIYHHHAQLLLKSHAYCSVHADDLERCLDPISFAATVIRYCRALDHTFAEINGLVSCMTSGIRPLSEELATGRSIVGKVVGVASNIAWRAIRFVGKGELIHRVRRLFLALGQTILKYRFELGMAAVVVVGAEPLMMALTATGVTTGAANSWSVVFGTLMRSVLLRIGCLVLKSPLAMSMLARWTMANIVLTDVFIDNAIVPLWKMIESGTGLAVFGLATDVVGTSVDVIRAMLQKVRKVVAADGSSTTPHNDIRKSFLEVAREFHATIAADFLYGFIAVWLGFLWEPIASVACSASEAILLVSNGVGAAVDSGANAASGFWMTVGAKTSNFFKRIIGNHSAELVTTMQMEDHIAATQMHLIAPKAIAVLHRVLSKLDLAMADSLNVAIDTIYNALSLVTKSTVVTAALSSLFCWFFESFVSPKKLLISHVSLLDAMGSASMDFNVNSCAGKRHGAECLFLGHQGLQNEEVLQGVCCLAVCQLAKDVCNAEPDQQVQGVAPSPAAFKHFTRQNKLLHGFVKMVRSSYGSQCAHPMAHPRVHPTVRSW